jgi:Ca2+-binding RTX toxin-like protein
LGRRCGAGIALDVSEVSNWRQQMLTISYSYAGSATQTIMIAETASAQDQTAAIQQALDAVADHAGGNVSLSAGTFLLVGTGKAADGALRVGSETTLEGAGLGSTILKLADGAAGVTGVVRTDSGRTLPDGTIDTTHNVTVRGLSIDGNAAHTTGATDGFYSGPKPGTAQFDTNITLDGVEIMNMSRYGFDPHEGTKGLQLLNCVAHNNAYDGFTIDGCSDVTIVNALAYDNGRHGINIVTGSEHVSIVDSVSRDNAANGITIQTGDNEIRGWTSDVTISGGLIAGNGRAGIDAHQMSGLDISGVTFSANGRDAIDLAGVDGAQLFGNHFYLTMAGYKNVGVGGYLQDFADTDATNDRYITSKGVLIDGHSVVDGVLPTGAVGWDYKVTAGADVISGSAGRDVVAAGSGDDLVAGNAGNDVLHGNDGNDTLDGGAGNDVLFGGWGNDVLRAGSGLDVIDGGVGFDTLDFSKFGAAVQVNLGAVGVEAMSGSAALADVMSIEAVRGTSAGDTLSAGATGATLDGAGGYDILNGGVGADTLLGGAGNDRLTGGTGKDVLTGGSGSDTLVFGAVWGQDTITDFARGKDKIALQGVDGLKSFAALSISALGADADIAFGGQHILLKGVVASSLTGADFIFS